MQSSNLGWSLAWMAALVVTPSHAQESASDARQILWQRSLADAQALAKASGRPLLVALNMDGESASERIVHELYRDKGFVAATRRCVCLAASVFRHSPRDHDDQGRRIPCPRLGEVTCGEHMALEPLLFDAYLADGERVAPRHALVLPGGKKAWDLSLCFDLRDVERALARTLAEASRDHAGERVAHAAPPAGDPPAAGPHWAALAARRDQRGRSELEAALLEVEGDGLLAALDQLAARGDAGTLAALRIVSGRLPRLADAARQRFVATTRRLGLEAAVAGALREQVQGLGSGPAALEAERVRAPLGVLAELDGASAATHALLLACRAVDDHAAAAQTAIAKAFDAAAAEAIEAAVQAHGGPVSLHAVLQLARAERAKASQAGHALPRLAPSGDAMPDSETLERQLGELDGALRRAPDDPELLARLAKASLDLGRQRLEAKRKDATLLIEDAAAYFERALATKPDRAPWWIEAARAAYFRGRFAEEAAFGRRAWDAASGGRSALPDERRPSVAGADGANPAALLEKAEAVEALRWIGDGCARLHAEPPDQDAAATIGRLIDALRALGAAAASPYGDVNDWTALASFLGICGLTSAALDAAREGALRLPAAAELRQTLNDTLWRVGRVDSAFEEAEAIARQTPRSAAAVWFAGYASMLVAESHRRCQRPAAAIEAYEVAQARFASAKAMQQDLAASCDHYIALAWHGRGMAHVLADRRDAAADCLVAAVTASPQLTTVRDGLDMDGLDLVDQVLEWRESRPSPVNALALLDRLAAVDPQSSFWAAAVADSELREALRADGRNPERVERDTVDAGGNKVRMPMGLPTTEGDAYLQASMAAGRRAVRLAATAENKHLLAQSCTISAERWLQRERPDEAREPLAEAAALLEREPCPLTAGLKELRALAAELRGLLGDARPRLRPGR